jgi:Mg2+/citrate symporter
MRFDCLPEDLKSIWEELDTNPVQLSPDQLRRETTKLQKGLRRRSVMGVGVCSFLIAGCTIFFFLFQNRLQRIGSVLTVAGAAYLLAQVLRMRARTVPDAVETDCVKFYRAKLERQRDFHRGKWFWSRMLMFTPGPVIFCIGFAQAYPKLAAGIRLELVAFLILVVIAVPLNLRLARKYRRRIDALGRSQRES